jgi:hypothetical protein
MVPRALVHCDVGRRIKIFPDLLEGAYVESNKCISPKDKHPLFQHLDLYLSKQAETGTLNAASAAQATHPREDSLHAI